MRGSRTAGELEFHFTVLDFPSARKLTAIGVGGSFARTAGRRLVGAPRRERAVGGRRAPDEEERVRAARGLSERLGRDPREGSEFRHRKSAWREAAPQHKSGLPDFAPRRQSESRMFPTCADVNNVARRQAYSAAAPGRSGARRDRARRRSSALRPSLPARDRPPSKRSRSPRRATHRRATTAARAQGAEQSRAAGRLRRRVGDRAGERFRVPWRDQDRRAGEEVRQLRPDRGRRDDRPAAGQHAASLEGGARSATSAACGRTWTSATPRNSDRRS